MHILAAQIALLLSKVPNCRSSRLCETTPALTCPCIVMRIDWVGDGRGHVKVGCKWGGDGGVCSENSGVPLVLDFLPDNLF